MRESEVLQGFIEALWQNDGGVVGESGDSIVKYQMSELLTPELTRCQRNPNT
jgi:hypothetical protein